MLLELTSPPTADLPSALHALAAELFPICRSLTGPGVRETLAVLGQYLPLGIHAVPSGTRVFDWTVPPEWHLHDAYVADSAGRRVIDVRRSNLHVLNFSAAVRARLSLAELRPHLHTLPHRPAAIPYRTSYYQRTWGFCLSQQQLDALPEGDYDVVIDAEHRAGSLHYGELVLPGESSDEVLVSAHVCHPSLANDNLSGIVVATFLARHLQTLPRRLTYRFLFAPATIGPLCFLARDPAAVERIRHGLVLTLLGLPGRFTYKRSRRGDAAIDRAVEHVLRHEPAGAELRDFSPTGYDERQFCSPGFDLPVGCLMRTPHGEFPEYHTSDDNLELVRPEALAGSLAVCRRVVEVLEHNLAYRNLAPYGEPQLGRRGLYGEAAGESDDARSQSALLWTLNLADGQHDLLAIAERSGLPFSLVRKAAELLQRHELLSPLAAQRQPQGANGLAASAAGRADRPAATCSPAPSPRLPRNACRGCGAPVTRSFVDLGMSPLCESFLTAQQLDEAEAFYPLHAYVCQRCWLVQLRQYVSADHIFSEYAYFSSYSDSWLRHARDYCATIAARLRLSSRSQVVEVASNDGYLLQNFVAAGIPVLGIEPAANVARAAVAKGVPTRVAFFGRATAEQLVAEGIRADLLVGNNVLAHVPDLNDFVAGLKTLLAPDGTLTLEFPHLMRLVEGNQFDTIYHEHFCYLSLLAAERVFAAWELALVDVEELPTHGGSLRVYVAHAGQRSPHPSVAALRDRERAAGYESPAVYEQFAQRVRQTKRQLLEFLIQARRDGRQVAAYGAPGKGNTLLNYCGIRQDFVDYCVDRNPYKHGKFTPGTHIPIHPPERLAETRPDYILILPWNLRDEIVAQLDYTRAWGAKLVLPIPELMIL